MAEKGANANVMRNFVDNLTLVITQVKDGESQRDEKDKFDDKAFWSRLGSIFTALSNEATKLSMAFSKPPAPTPEESEPMVTALERATLSLVSAFYSYPKSQGLTLRKALRTAVMDILTSIKSLAEKLASLELGSQEQLQATGLVWYGTDVISTLPKDNQRACLVVVEETSDLVRDVLHELQEAVENEGQMDDLDEMLIADGLVMCNEDTWTEADKELLAACTGLIKMVKAMMKKTKEAVKQNGVCETEATIAQLDDLVDNLGTVSPATDNLAACLYPPMQYQQVLKLTDELSAHIENFLHFIKQSHMTGETDEQWVEFLLKANKHNQEKIHSIVLKS